MASQLPHVATGVKATRCEEKSGVVVGISTTEGPVSPGSVIFATGGPPALAGLDVGVPSDFVKGHLAATAPVSLTLPGSVAQLATQIEDGRLLVGGTVDADDLTPGVNAEVLEGVRRQLVATWPQLRDAALTHQWCCWRPHHPDSLPVIDRVPGLENAWFTSGHYRTGILMAPVTARLLSEWVSTGQAPALAGPLGHKRTLAVLSQPSFEVGDEGSHVKSEHFVRIDARPEGVGLVQPGLERRPLLRQVVVEHRPA